MTVPAANMTLEQVFANFGKFGDGKADGKSITLTNADKWMKQAQIIDGKKITTTDTGMGFNKFKSKNINYQDFIKFVEDLAASKNADAQELKNKLLACGMPGTTPATQATKVVEANT